MKLKNNGCRSFLIKVLLNLTLASGLIQSVYAAVDCNTSRCKGPMREIVTGMFPAAGNGDLIVTAAAAIQVFGCTPMAGGNNLLLRKTHPSFDAAVAIALIAESGNRFVTLKRDITTTDCIIQYLRIGE